MPLVSRRSLSGVAVFDTLWIPPSPSLRKTVVPSETTNDTFSGDLAALRGHAVKTPLLETNTNYNYNYNETKVKNNNNNSNNNNQFVFVPPQTRTNSPIGMEEGIPKGRAVTKAPTSQTSLTSSSTKK